MQVRYKSKFAKPRKKVYTKAVTMLFDEETLNAFKRIVGKGYQVKIRELVEQYVKEYSHNNTLS